MQLRNYFLRKIQQQLKIIALEKEAPKQKIKLNALDPQDYLVDLQSVTLWSNDNITLYQQILENGMAEFICNQPYLLAFYRQLKFPSSQIETLSQGVKAFSNLKVLDLTDNKIVTLENIPASLEELYADFNFIKEINLTANKIVLLSVSHNQIDDNCYISIVKSMPQLRSLNISFNHLNSLRLFVKNLPKKLKILISFMNSFSILGIYRQYILKNIKLVYFDGKNISNEEIKKEEVKKQEIKKPIEQIKDTKLNKLPDSKNTKNIQEQKKEILPVQENIKEKQEIKKQLTEEDFSQATISINIVNIQNVKGIIFDSTTLPQGSLTQSQYFIKCFTLGKQFVSEAILFQNFTIDNEERLCTFNFIIKEIVHTSEWKIINKGALIEILKKQPKTIIDENGQLKPLPSFEETSIGGIFVDLKELILLEKKQLSFKYKVFDSSVAKHPLFSCPLLEEQKLIQDQKALFQEKLLAMQKEKQSKIQAQENAKNMKKKDSKKAPEKKIAKKQGKQQLIQKKKNEKNEFPFHSKVYCNFGNKIMHKCQRQIICVSVKIQ